MHKSERQPQTISGVVHSKQRLIMSRQHEPVLIKPLKDFINFCAVTYRTCSKKNFEKYRYII